MWHRLTSPRGLPALQRGWRQARGLKDPAWGDRVRAKKLRRINDLLEQHKAVRGDKAAAPNVPLAEQQNAVADGVLQERVEGAAALERLERKEAMEGEDEPHAMQHLDDTPVKHYIILAKGRERLKGSIVHPKEMALSHSKPPAVGDNPCVQIRSASGDRILGYGLWKHGKGSVYVVLWVSAVRSRLSPNTPKEKSLDALSLGRRFWFHRFFKALEYRQSVLDLESCDMFRFIDSDADGCPGLTVDLFSNAAAVTVTDYVAVAYLALLLEFLQTRTPATVIHVATTTSAKKFPQKMLGYQPKAPSNVGAARVVQENGLLLGVSLDNRHLLLSPAKRSFRDAVARYCAGRRVVVLNDVNGSLGANAIRVGAQKCLFVHHNEQQVATTKKNITRNFFSDELQVKSLLETRGFAHHCPDLESRVRYADSGMANFVKKVDQGVFDTVVMDLATDNADFTSSAWCVVLLLNAIRKVDVSSSTGGFLVFISHFDLRETQELVKSAAEKTNRDIRLVEPIVPTPDAAKSAFTYSRPVFSGWVVNIRKL